MAIRWETRGLGVQHGFLGGTRIFVLLHPLDGDEGGCFRLVCDLPGEAAGKLVQEHFTTRGEAMARAHRFTRHWLGRYTEWLADADEGPDVPHKQGWDE